MNVVGIIIKRGRRGGEGGGGRKSKIGYGKWRTRGREKGRRCEDGHRKWRAKRGVKGGRCVLYVRMYAVYEPSF